VRWWLNADHKAFSVDNAAVRGMDFSSLPTDLWMVQWNEDKGEIEYQTASGENLNGLRETIIDIIPYAPFFDQFLTLLPGLTLPQAKKVKNDLIRQIFETKRQAPYHYPVAAGDYWWDASDETMFSSLIPQIQNIIAKVNEIVARLNSAMPEVSGAQTTLVNQINANIVNSGDTLVSEINSNIAGQGNILVSEINSDIVYQGNVLRDEINTNIVNPTRNIAGEVGGNVVNPVNNFFSTITGYISGTLLGTLESPSGGGSNTINEKLQSRATVQSEPVYVALPGLGAAIAHFVNPGGASYLTAASQPVAVATAFLNLTTAFVSVTADFLYVSGGSLTPWTPLTNVPTSNVQWIPVGETAPVDVTPSEQAAIMQGIASRTNDLSVKKNIKIGEVNALTTIAAVIAYDVTTGW